MVKIRVKGVGVKAGLMVPALSFGVAIWLAR